MLGRQLRAKRKPLHRENSRKPCFTTFENPVTV